MRFIVGLGNPGRRYAKTRHNIGWMVLAALRRRWQVASGRSGFGGVVYDARLVGPDGQVARVVMLEPLTYMNRSGEAVNGLVKYYRADCHDVLVILDDMALPLGRVRVRPGGSAGGHNGLKDIIALLGTEEVPRLRVGIGQAPPEVPSEDYVLAKFEKHELDAIAMATEAAAAAAQDWIYSDIKYVMDKYNANNDA